MVIGGCTVPFTPAKALGIPTENGSDRADDKLDFCLLIGCCEDNGVPCSGCNVVVSGTTGVCPLVQLLLEAVTVVADDMFDLMSGFDVRC